MSLMLSSASDKYLKLLDSVLINGFSTETPKGKTIEVLSNRTVWDMQYPIIEMVDRKLNYGFMFKEAAWVLSGDNRLAPLNEHIVRYHRFSDDGLFLAGAYGPQFVSQLPYVIRNLFSDPSSRQAVISLWKPSPQKSKDIPCTLTVQALIRDEKLYLVVNMRSSDTWLGIPYDVFTFSMMGTYILACLNRYGSNKFGFCKLGQLFLNVGSQHIYEENLKNVIALLDKRNKYEVFRHRHPDGGAPEYILEQLEIQAKEEFELRKTAGWDKEYTIIDKE